MSTIQSIYLIVSLISLTYTFYRTITNIIRRSKGLSAKKYISAYSCLSNITHDDDPIEYYAALCSSVILTIFWPIHWSIYIIYICIKRIILPLLTRLTLSKEERVQVAIGAVKPNENWNGE